ncbi:phage antirepressor N-terminal domain-containing protein [Enterobacter asburiae]|uniref:phage antirepressor N-terminal domain-containing protein n=1 Tax=Enterobacter asburiae TaxID=61645 RepID=UPI00192A704F|nr:phage antirepressor N-terminal domain-containing protein [Enterobacter asburiae]MBL5911220.1 phage antirepressor N-terminal domain-containing protein [Enterobacter asburiae]
MSIATAVSTINVPFHGAELYVVSHNGEPYTPMRPIVEGMGMTWQSQLEKIKQRFSSTVTEIVMVASDGKSRSMTCLALRKLSAWLNTISPNKVKPEIRDTVIRYQDECDDVLYEYWTKGEVKRKSATTTDERTPLRDAINFLVGKKSIMYPEAYKLIHQRFNVAHIDEVPAEQLPEAIEYIHRLALEGELLPKEPQPANPAMPIFPIGINFQYVVTVESGCVIEMRPLRQGEMVASAEDMIWMLRKTGWVVELAEDMDAMNSTALAQLIQRSAAMRIQAF